MNFSFFHTEQSGRSFSNIFLKLIFFTHYSWKNQTKFRNFLAGWIICISKFTTLLYDRTRKLSFLLKKIISDLDFWKAGSSGNSDFSLEANKVFKYLNLEKSLWKISLIRLKTMFLLMSKLFWLDFFQRDQFWKLSLLLWENEFFQLF